MARRPVITEPVRESFGVAREALKNFNTAPDSFFRAYFIFIMTCSAAVEAGNGKSGLDGFGDLLGALSADTKIDLNSVQHRVLQQYFSAFQGLRDECFHLDLPDREMVYAFNIVSIFSGRLPMFCHDLLRGGITMPPADMGVAPEVEEAAETAVMQALRMVGFRAEPEVEEEEEAGSAAEAAAGFAP